MREMRMRVRFTIGFALVWIGMSPLAYAQAPGAGDGLVVQTSGGQVRGHAGVDGGAQFLGIPFAQPPVGELRWHEPLPAKPWSGVLEANKAGAPCAQPPLGAWNRHDAELGQEDCLYLNVMTPAWPAKGPWPVMFWLHGGANEGGTASSSLYNDGTLPKHGVVLVTVNYRLGVFGFMAHPELTQESAHHASGNYGLMDQILALKWVIDNISKFGGDARNITVFGQSAGSMDTGLLMTSTAKGLFQKAIQESGAPFSPLPPPLAAAEKLGERFASGMGAPASGGTIKFLRDIPAQELIKKWIAMEQRPHFGPIVDGWVVPERPAEVFASGHESPIPLLFGTTQREFGSEAPLERVRAGIAMQAGSHTDEILAAYGLNNGGQGAADPLYGSVASQVLADAQFRCPATTEGRWHSAANHPVYEYEFDHATPGQEAGGAVHSSELSYVFGFYPKEGNLAGAYTATDYKISDLLESYWTNFAKTGNPNSDGLPVWPAFGTSYAFIRINQDGTVTAAMDLRSAQCAAYRAVAADMMNKAK